MKRSMLWTTILAASFAFGTGCRDNDREKAADEYGKAQEMVREEQADVIDEQKDVNEAKRDLAVTRREFEATMNDRMARLDTKIDELERRGDDKSKEMAASLRARRDQAKAKLYSAGDKTDSAWEEFKTDVTNTWNELEKDVDNAF
jgi:hypothetical protein